ncbi:MAG: cyanophycin synthetase, partial [Desulfobulbaceae bacterium]|nr:cyanophycin synthetase [Desulfobulbaceae bacterium]
AFLWFAERKVDCAIIETGLGGRLDATNIIRPRVSIITNIAMDHEAYLGTTLAEIAAEKAGIIKAGVPVVSGASGPSVAEVILQVAQKVESPLYLQGRDFRMTRTPEDVLGYQGIGGKFSDLKLGLRGSYQVDNTALALAGIELWLGLERRLDPDVVREGLLAVRWPGRLEFFSALNFQGRSRAVLFDGAHNPAGVDALCEALRSDFHYHRVIMVWASMGDKDFQTCVGKIAPLCSRIIFTRPETLRSATPEQLVHALPEDLRSVCLSSSSVEDALEQAYALAEADDLICIAGSLYLIGRARSVLVGGLVGD